MLFVKYFPIPKPHQSPRRSASITCVLLSLLLGLSLASAAALAQAPPAPPTILAIDGSPVGLVHEFTGLPLTPDGWTDLDALIESEGYSDARILYVSSSDGSDATGRVYSQAEVMALGGTPTSPGSAVSAYATIGAARNQLRLGYPDVLLLKRGDVFNEGLAGNLPLQTGRSKTERRIFAAYGNSGDLPNVRGVIGTGTGGGGAPNFTGYIVIANISNYHPRNDPAMPEFNGTMVSTGLSNLRGGEDVLVEGMRFQFDGPTWQGSDGTQYRFAFRRNSVSESYPSGTGHKQGFYASNVTGLLLEENVFDHNGWINRDGHSAGPTLFNHNVYLAANNREVVVRGNVLANSSSNSMQGRPGGVIFNNLMLREPIGAFLARAGGIHSYNVMLDSASRSDGGHGWGLADQSTGTTLVEYNIVAHKADGTGTAAQAFSIETYHMADSNTAGMAGYDGPKDSVYRGNVFYNWHGHGFSLSSGGSFPDYGDVASITLEGNRIVLPASASARRYIQVSNTEFDGKVHLSGNEYQGPAGATFRYLGTDMNFETWVATTGEIGSSFGEITFTDPTRDVASYMSSIGMAGDVAEFLAIARSMHRFNWDDRFTAAAVNSYIREGFDVPNP